MDATFDPSISYVTAAGGRYADHDLAAGYPVKVTDEPTRPAEFTPAQMEQLVAGGKLVPVGTVRPTPVERPEDAVERLADLEPMEDDKFLIRAPWLDEAETVTGAEKAQARLVEVKEQGLEHYRKAEGIAAKTLAPNVAADVAGATLTGGDGFMITDDGSNGYYTITKPDGSTERVRGKDKAETRMAEMRAEAAAPPTDDTSATDGEEG
jgi:hypothetical protein